MAKTQVTLGIDPSFSSAGWAFLYHPPRKKDPVIQAFGSGPIFRAMPDIEAHLREVLAQGFKVRIAVERMPSAFSMSTAIRALARGVTDHMKRVYKTETNSEKCSFVYEVSPDKWRQASHGICRGPRGAKPADAEKVVKDHAILYANSFKIQTIDGLVRADFSGMPDAAEAVCIAYAIGRLKGGW